MKKRIARALILILCLAPVLVCAQSVTTEMLLGQLLVNLLEQVERPSFALTLETGKENIDACFALDEQNIPDFTLGIKNGNEELRMDIDRHGLRYKSNAQRIAVTVDTVMRILDDELNIGLMDVDVCEDDLLLLEQIAMELINASKVCISNEVAETDAVQKDGAGLMEEEQLSQNRTIIDINVLLAALDQVIPEMLNRHADALNALVERNRLLIHEVLNGELGEMREIAQNWPEGYLVRLIPEDVKLIFELEMQEENWTLTGYCNRIEIARIAKCSGRLYGALGVRGEYAFDSDDLKVLAQMLCDISHYVSKEAFTWRLGIMDNSLTAHLKLDSRRLLDDFATGMTSVMREKRSEIENLLARYTPWIALADAEHTKQLNWESIYYTVKEELEKAVEQYSNDWQWRVIRNKLLNQLFGRDMPKLEMDLYVQKRLEGIPEIIWSFAAPSLNAELMISGSLVKGSYHWAGSGMMPKYGYVNGFISENTEIVIGHQTGGKTDMRLTIDAKRENDGWTALVYDMNGAEKAKLMGNDTGWNLTINDEKDTVLAQWYAYDGMWRGKIYANGEELNGMLAEEHDASVLRITHKEKYGYGQELTLRAGLQNLSLLSGETYNGSLRTGIDLDVQWSDRIPRVNGVIHAKNGRVMAAYLPGQLDFSIEDTEYNWKWEMHAEDLRVQKLGENETRVEILSTKMVDEKKQFSEERWTIRTQPGTQQWIAQIIGDTGENMMLKLDFAAQPQKQDLTNYIWLTEDQVRRMFSEEETSTISSPTVVSIPSPTPQLSIEPIYDMDPAAVAVYETKGFQSFKIEIAVANGKIVSVKCVEHNETPGFGADILTDEALSVLVGQEIATARVDVKSGVTMTSNGINEALKAAGATERDDPTAAEKESSSAVVYDVKGFQTMKVAVDVDEAGEIVSVNVIEHNETPGFGADLINGGFRSLEGQNIASAQIDVKSGVTLTSNGINEALKMAAVNHGKKEKSIKVIPDKDTASVEAPEILGPALYKENAAVRGHVVITIGGRQYGDPIPMDYEKIITLRQDDGKINKVHITPEKVYMESSTCDNQDCIEQGEIHVDTYKKRILSTYIICLPNNVSIEMVPAELE